MNLHGIRLSQTRHARDRFGRLAILLIVLSANLDRAGRAQGATRSIGTAGGGVTATLPDPAAANTEAKKPLPRGSVAGMIICSDTRRPARSGRIMLLPMGEFEDTPHAPQGNQSLFAVTGLDGHFVIEHVSPGEYLVVALAAGYLSPLDAFSMSNPPNKAEKAAMAAELRRKGPIVRVSGDEQARVEIELVRGVEFSGHVIYSDGAPASQLPVKVEKKEQPKAAANPTDIQDVGMLFRSLILQQRMTTDDEGHFRLSGIAPGSYVLAVSQSFDNNNLTTEMVSAMYPGMAKSASVLTVYSGNELHRGKAKVYDVAAGDRVDDIEIVLPLNGLHTLHGKALGVDGAGLNGGTVHLTDTVDPTITFESGVAAGGDFRFTAIPEGTYDLTLTHGRIYANPPDANQFQAQFSDEQLDQAFRPVRAFSDLKQSLVVSETNPDFVNLTLTDTKLPDLPKPVQGVPPGDDEPPR